MSMSTKRKASSRLAAPVAKTSAKPVSRTTVDESKTAVSAPDDAAVEMIEISSDANSSDEDDISDDDAAAETTTKSIAKLPSGTPNGKLPAQLPTADTTGDDEGSDAEGAAPSFGELLRGNDAIDVPALLQQSSNTTSLQRRSAAIAAPSHQSLTTVLTQALRTDDTELLESCLHTEDHPTIQNTIERIDSALAGTLLQKLASRLHRRPGRAGKLMLWVQWTLISHGGALATQPKIVQSLSSLQKVLAERASGLNSLLALKGKLDLLEGQMDLRRRMQLQAGTSHKADESDDENVIWVEGEDRAATISDAMTNGLGSRAGLDDDDDEEPVMNGLAGDSDEEDDSEEELGDSDGGEDEFDDDDVEHEEADDSMGEDDESDVEAPPSKKRK